jgi:hypothetical protein
VTHSSSAALEKLPSRAVLQKACNSCSEGERMRMR